MSLRYGGENLKKILQKTSGKPWEARKPTSTLDKTSGKMTTRKWKKHGREKGKKEEEIDQQQTVIDSGSWRNW